LFVAIFIVALFSILKLICQMLVKVVCAVLQRGTRHTELENQQAQEAARRDALPPSVPPIPITAPAYLPHTAYIRDPKQQTLGLPTRDSQQQTIDLSFERVHPTKRRS
jgi:hypothetical protein